MASLPHSLTSPSLASSISTRSESDQQQMRSSTRSSIASNGVAINGAGTTAGSTLSLATCTSSQSPRSTTDGGKMKVERSCAESEQQQEQTEPVKKYSSKTLSKEAFRVLDNLRQDGHLCDVTINVGDKEFKAHRVVLAATSPYFLAMFNGKLSESKQEVVTLKEVKSSAIEQLIQFVYTGTIEVNEENVQDLLPPASLLRLTEVCGACCEFLKDQLDPTNCLGIKDFADVHSCDGLFEEAKSYAQKHFTKVMESDEFYSLSHKDVIELIKSPDLGVLFEEEVFEAVILWTKHNIEERTPLLPELFDHVGFKYFRKEYLIQRVYEEELMQMNPACKDFLIDALRHHLLPLSDRTSNCAPRKRIGSPRSILTVGGQAPKAVRNVEIFDVTSHACHNGPELLSKRCRCGVTVLNNSVYAVGGFDGTSRVRSVERLDLETKRWIQVEPMMSRRSTLGVAVLKGELYAVGGFDGNNGLDSVEKYNPETKQWTTVASMNTRRSSVGVAVMNDLLYAVGGYDGYARQCLNSVEVYNPTTNEWSIVEPMIQRRSGAAVAVIDNLLYAIGGHDGPDIRKSVEYYDPQTNKWSRIPEMFTCRRNAAAAVVHNILYVVGGDDGVTNLPNIEIYDPIFRTWKTAQGTLTLGRSYAGVAVVDRPADTLPVPSPGQS